VYKLVNEVSPTTKKYPIHCAVDKNDLRLVRLLIEKGADLRKTVSLATRKRQSFASNAQANSIRSARGGSFSSLGEESGLSAPDEELNDGEGGINSQIARLDCDEKYAMGAAAKRGYLDVLKELVLVCWEFTDIDTSVAAGAALDYAFHNALRDLKFDQAIGLMVACWRRNDLASSKYAVVATIYYSLSIVRAVKKQLHQKQVRRLPKRPLPRSKRRHHASNRLRLSVEQVELGVEEGDTGDLELQDLNRQSLRAQLLASCLLQSIGPKKVEDALNDAWKGIQPLAWCTRLLFRDAVRYDCEHLLASTALQGFLRRKWRGRLIDQLITRRVYSKTQGITQHMKTDKWLTVRTDARAAPSANRALLIGCPIPYCAS
jgi:hypothetical protein